MCCFLFVMLCVSDALGLCSFFFPLFFVNVCVFVFEACGGRASAVLVVVVVLCACAFEVCD